MRNIIIFNPAVARDLIQGEFKITDIQPHKKYPRETIFYFEYSESLKKYLNEKHDIYIK